MAVVSAADGLPRVWASRRRVYVVWDQWPGGAPAVMINLGQWHEEVLAHSRAVPADAVELGPIIQTEGP